MHSNAGVYRKEEFLSEGCKQISQIAKEMDDNLKVGGHCVEFGEKLQWNVLFTAQ